MNREALQEKFVQATIESMDLDDMFRALYEMLDEKISKCSDSELSLIHI